ncbi:50S ribosomal protein L40e [Candidatus Woesearchaeota archaeon]|nr:50S ribosomal protein L40e [Candidatus Woesearchaeota archaeon]
MVKFKEAEERMFRNVFICRRCKTANRAPARKIAESKVTCRKCGYKRFKPKRKK